MRKCYEEQKELFTAIMSVQMPERPGDCVPPACHGVRSDICQ